MTREEMLKQSWKAYMEINYKHPRMKEPILCLLVQIDFDDESMTLQPLFGKKYINEDFIANINHCSIPPKKMQAAFVEGKKVKPELEEHEYQGSSNNLNPYWTFGDNDDNKAS